MRKIIAVSVLLAVAACGGPLGPLAGGRLSGRPVAEPVSDWTFVKSYELMEIETRPDAPYSVKVHYYLIDGRLYVEAGENSWSRWRPYLHADPNVRVRFGDGVYPARAVRVTDPAEIARVLPRYYEKDRDEAGPACRREWTVEACGFEGALYRLESTAPPG